MKYTFTFIFALCLALSAQAQPTKRRSTTSNAAAQQGASRVQPTDRAALMFPKNVEVPEDVVWKRDIYRQLDLTKDKNAPLYYPLQPVGIQCNLFTYLFRLVLTGRVPAYNYMLDGNESFAEKDKIRDITDLLNRYYVPYKEEGGKIVVDDRDVPGEQVKRYYIKESVVLDQRTGTHKTQVQALCPVLMENDDFGEGASPKPLFWVKYADVESYLSRLPVMASNYNNTTNMTANDFFTLNRYEGTIYKTNNMQGRVLGDYCKTDSAMKKEQKKIENELKNFEAGIWQVKQAQDTTKVDSLQAEQARKRVSTRRQSTAKENTTTTARANRRSAQSRKEKTAAATTEPRASVRRVRR